MDSLQNITSYLSEIFEIPKEAVETCSNFCMLKKVVKNEFLLQEGEICTDTFFVEKGLLRMYSLDRNGKEHIIQFAPENWLISDRSSLNFNQKSKYYIEAVEDSEVFILSKDFFINMIEKFPQTAENNDLLLQKHIRNLQNRVNSLLADTAEERYMSFIKMYPDILLRVPQWMVASYLGITPESLSRVRKELARKNFETS
ncbi:MULTISPECIES: Crp/Fnr family transcriptional regulator [unclassified Kaistella]|uniref:Crp/Fnr family transcriptional regulator n=1 Tax=unclassified Kaistella TaxID=2762626 RepID=UPI00273335A4|nr:MULTISPECIES: Crp/Fnr family transcriptional regulator [unclassified Kaistella]MCZ2082887.1 Crp/Fnr family transcriptional regulator [Flavobacteriales bacterium]MDP2453983.1 Crp/Fnr family transcriptional regulator [Kaistella sp. SH11-4b]MDP2457040.1 Crp/Fnr family transcriptional regulator [Kaistella sp. SH40-3]MDP2459797.1 Crp/Fnr family transcriptional regulator [Kaistella sp. SH19-2b]